MCEVIMKKNVIDFDPEFLYRYRKIDEYTYQDLIGDRICAVIPEMLNDPFDASITYNKQEIISYLKSHYPNDLARAVLTLPAPDYDDEETAYNNKLQDIIENISSEKYRNVIDNYCDLLIKQIMTFIRSSVYVVCFTTKKSDPNMWSHYSDYGKGLILKYRFQDIKKLENCLAYPPLTYRDTSKFTLKPEHGIYKIKYVKERIDCTDVLKNSITFNKEKFLKSKCFHALNEIFTTKFNSWDKENEYRLVFDKQLKFRNSIDDLTNQYLESRNEYKYYLFGIRPETIYISQAAELSSKYLICMIAESKNIPVYEVSPNYNKKVAGYKYTKLTCKDINVNFL